MKKTIYVFLRKDLPGPQKVVQASHVCLELARAIQLPDERYNIVVFGIKSLPKLQGIIDELSLLKILFVQFIEPDLNQLTALATTPLSTDEGKVFSRYRLLEG